MTPMQRQLALMRLLDRNLRRKVMAIDLGLSESELCRYASGTRAMPIDVAMAAIRLLDGGVRTTALRILLDGMDHEATPTGEAPVASNDAAAELMDVVEGVGRVSATLRAARADGKVTDEELDVLADEVQQLKQQVGELAAALPKPGLREVKAGGR
jgi:DNA-binding transcriptional regulator YdaS (Cro superfamily)